MDNEMTLNLKQHIDWLVAHLVNQDLILKDVDTTIRAMVVEKRKAMMVELHLKDVKENEVAVLTGFSHSVVNSAITDYWKHKETQML